MNPNTEVTVGDRELTITRIFDAPRPLVFFAWSTPKHLMRWFAPNNFTVPECEMDFRDGGKVPAVHARLRQGPLDERRLSRNRQARANRLDQLVGKRQQRSGHDGDVHVIGGKTRLTVHQTYSIETDSTRGAPQGWTETLDHLAEYLADA